MDNFFIQTPLTAITFPSQPDPCDSKYSCIHCFKCDPSEISKIEDMNKTLSIQQQVAIYVCLVSETIVKNRSLLSFDCFVDIPANITKQQRFNLLVFKTLFDNIILFGDSVSIKWMRVRGLRTLACANRLLTDEYLLTAMEHSRQCDFSLYSNPQQRFAYKVNPIRNLKCQNKTVGTFIHQQVKLSGGSYGFPLIGYTLKELIDDPFILSVFSMQYDVFVIGIISNGSFISECVVVNS